MKAITIVALCGVTLAGGVAAQAAAVRPPPGGCFRGAPADRCSWFVLTEAGVHYRLTDVIPGDEHVLFNGALGFMVNTAGGAAWGGEAFAGVEGDVRGGLALRWRRWLGGRSSLDLAAGAHLLGDASSGTVQAGSPMFQARYTLGDQLGASARFDLLRIRNGCPDENCFPRESWTSGRLYVGGEFGSSLGLGAMIVAGLALAALVVSFGS
jgi:hypothetical protein